MARQQHIVYSYQMGLSGWYDFSNELALPDRNRQPSPINEYAFTIKYPYVVRLVIFNFNAASIKHYKNQLVITGEPLRKGITILDFDTKNLPASKKLLQLATPDGYELDYLTLNLKTTKASVD
jgi:hypothetical protein